uniref:Metal tolerance protein C2 n=1 Tax=Aegilops tauschii TaxID=37682 RepID=M8D9J0_AEGTA
MVEPSLLGPKRVMNMTKMVAASFEWLTSQPLVLTGWAHEVESPSNPNPNPDLFPILSSSGAGDGDGGSSGVEPQLRYKRLEVLAAFTNALFLLFMSFSLAVEALHSFMQDESEHKHYLIVSAVTNLLVNLLGVWFFRSYARVNIVYRKAEDMNHHSICLHVLADSVRRLDTSFLVSFIGVTPLTAFLCSFMMAFGFWLSTCVCASVVRIENAEVLCLGIVSVAVFMLVMPLFKATGNVLLQIAPGNVPPSAFIKCGRQITACEDVSEVSQARFWELVPGHAVGCLSIRLKNSSDDESVLEYVHGLYEDLGIHDLTIQTEKS